jgi:tetratricopeptide (TPR) repeat protein
MRSTVRIGRIAGLSLLLLAPAVRADDQLEPDDLPDPRPEIARGESLIDPPAVPDFALPPAEAGFRRPRELRVRGAAALGREIKVKGYITSIYDCASELAVRHPEASRVDLLLSIDRDPSQCQRPRFTLGDSRDVSPDTSISVVEVPRYPARPEREALSRDELAQWPAVPRIATGDYVVVAGTWATRSPHNEQNTAGLLVYQSLELAVPSEPTAAAAPTADVPGATTQTTTDTTDAPAADAVAVAVDTIDPPEVAIETRPRLRKVVDLRIYNRSVDRLNACTKHIVAGDHDAGIASCRSAIAIWNDNHLAWYTLASAYIAKREWPLARTAAERAVAARPDQAMYQLYYGIALYEAELARVHDEQAHRRPGDAIAEPQLGPAREALWRAAVLEPDLWRAHYYLGRLHRDLDDARRAAARLTRALALHPTYGPGYIALSELYRRWDYVDAALAVALLGTQHVRADAELWYEAGMAQSARRADPEAIAAFGKAVVGRADLRAKFQRGQIYLRNGDLVRARRDLSDVVESTDPQVAAVKSIAQQLLGELERRLPRAR